MSLSSSISILEEEKALADNQSARAERPVKTRQKEQDTCSALCV
jgi:hypothetical protein